MISIIEVGPRDGLQAIKKLIPQSLKIAFIEKLIDCGLREIEIASFVSKKWVPQMADSLEVAKKLEFKNKYFLGLVPNLKGYQVFKESKLKKVAFFTAVSDEFNQKNVNFSFDEHFLELSTLIKQARLDGYYIRLYVSTLFDCPYTGKMSEKLVLKRLEKLASLDFDDLSLGDTIGKATPRRVRSLSKSLVQFLNKDKISYHFHDTYAMALANCAEAINLGFKRFDTSASGLGGCPFAPGAAGNLATEDLVFFLEGEGIKTTINFDLLVKASENLNLFLKRTNLPKSVRK